MVSCNNCACSRSLSNLEQAEEAPAAEEKKEEKKEEEEKKEKVRPASIFFLCVMT